MKTAISPHGTNAHYTAGCRCVDCKEARRVYRQHWVVNHPDSTLASNRRYRAKDPEAVARNSRRSHLAKTYGLSQETYDQMFSAQGGVCAICHEPEPSRNHLYVDHDHQTGRIRGLLCNRCNLGLGALGDEPARLRQAVAYLEHAAW